MELESQHQAKAIVFTSKQRALREDGDGDSSSTAGPKAQGPSHRADERKSLFA